LAAARGTHALDKTAKPSRVGGAIPSTFGRRWLTSGAAQLGPASFFTDSSLPSNLLRMCQTTLASGTHAGVDAMNDVFSALGVQLHVIRPSSRSAVAQVRVSSPVAGKVRRDTLLGGLSPKQFVRSMRQAQTDGKLGDMDLYIKRMEAEGLLQPISLLPDGLQWTLYADVGRILVFSVQRLVLGLDRTSILGHELRVTSTPSVARNIHSFKDRKARLIGDLQLHALVNSLMKREAIHMQAPNVFQRRLYTNCMKVILHIGEDILCLGDEEEKQLFGHAAQLFFEPRPVDVVRTMSEDTRIAHCKIDDKLLMELVSELLADPGRRKTWIPTALEAELYCGTLRCMARVLEDALLRLRLKVLGSKIKMYVRSCAEAKAAVDKAADTTHYFYGDENPLRLVSTTELHQRANEFNEMKRMFEALRRLGGIHFDLTAEKPMTSTAPPTLASEGDVLDMEGIDEVHEFQRLAISIRLARTLNLGTEVQADIAVPYHVIADIESYPLWMPWVTSGRFISPSTLVDPETNVGQRDCDIGMGFETGTFLGTVGDTIRYGLRMKPPTWGKVARKEPTVLSAQVVADAIDGFAYGERLIYDWRFRQVSPRTTRVEVDILFQARSVIFLPIWTSMKTMFIEKLLVAFKARAELLERQRSGSEDMERVVGLTDLA